MSLIAEDMLDRRRLRRKVSFWRVVAILVAALAVIGLALAYVGKEGEAVFGSEIASVKIEGVITESRPLLKLLGELEKDDAVKAVVLRVDSPGGTTSGGESLYEAVRKISAAKPVVAEVGGLAASAAYMVAAGSDHIVARRTSIVGSIGVLFQYVDASDLLDTVGVKVNAIKSSPMKAEPSPFAPAPEEAKAMIRRLILDTYDWFVQLVADRRGFSLDQARTLADGSVWTGRQALDLKLVDAIGAEEAVRDWLSKERGISVDLPVVERKPEKEGSSWSIFARASAAGLRLAGLDRLKPLVDRLIGPDPARLDGLISLWQP